METVVLTRLYRTACKGRTVRTTPWIRESFEFLKLGFDHVLALENDQTIAMKR